MMGPRKDARRDNTHRRTWNTEEYEERAKARIAAQPEPYRIWASQKSHRPKHLDQNMELKRKFGGPSEENKKSEGDGGGVGNVYLKGQSGGDPTKEKRIKEEGGEAEKEKSSKSSKFSKKSSKGPEPHADPDLNPDGSKKSKRIAAKSRGYNFAFEDNVGQTALATQNKRGNGLHAGYYCSVCDCTLADSQSWLGHLNGRRHQKNLGLSVFKHTRSDVGDVMAAITEKKTEMNKDKEEYNFDKKVKDAEEEMQKLKDKYKFDKKERKRKRQDVVKKEVGGGEGGHPEQDDMMAMMGFSGFSTSKKAT